MKKKFIINNLYYFNDINHYIGLENAQYLFYRLLFNLNNNEAARCIYIFWCCFLMRYYL